MTNQLIWTADVLCAPAGTGMPIDRVAPRHNCITPGGTSLLSADERHGYGAVKPAAPPRGVPR